MSFSRDEIKKELQRRNALPASNFSRDEIANELKSRGISIPGDSSNSRKGFHGIYDDAMNGIYNVPDAIGNFLSNLPKNTFDAGKQIVTDPLRAIINLGGGVRMGLEGAINTPSNIASYLNSKDIGKGSIEDALMKMRVPDSHLEEALLGAVQPGDMALRGFGSVLPYGPLGGAEKGLAGMARRSGAAGAYAAGQNQNPVTAALSAGIAEKAPSLIYKGGKKAYDSAKPSNLFRGNLSPDELKENLKAAEGTNTPLGQIIGSPTLNTVFENMTSEVPFSGADNILGNIKNQVTNNANDILKQTKPGNSQGDLNYDLKNALNNAFKQNRKIKNEMYTDRDKIANQELFTPDLTNFNNQARQLKEGIQGSAFYSVDPVFKSLFDKVSGLEKASDVVSQGKTKRLTNDEQMAKGIVSSPTITESTMLARQLQEKGKYLLKSTSARDKAAGGLYADLGNTLKDDIESSIKNKGSEKLQKAHEDANKNFKENYVGFLDKDINKTLNDEPESLVAEIVKPSKKFDRFKRIEKINNLLDPDQAKILGHHYLSASVDDSGKIDPKQLAQLIKQLGPRQTKALFPDLSVQENLKNFTNLRDMNEKSLSMMENPRTGARNIKLLAAALAAKLSLPVTGAAYAGSTIFNSMMTNPKIRQNLVEKMIQNSQKENKTGNSLTPYREEQRR